MPSDYTDGENLPDFFAGTHPLRIAQTQLRKSEGQLLVVMIIIDVCFLVLNFVHAYTWYLPDAMFAVTQHQGYAEFFQYAKMTGCIVILARAYLRGREPLLLSWVLVFCYLLLVEALELNQFLATTTLDLLSIDPIRSAQALDSVELLWAGSILLVFVVTMLYQFGRSHAELKQDSLGLVSMVAILVLFTFMLDHLHAALKLADTHLFFLAAIVEDFGGMLAMSLAVIGVHLVFVRTVRSQRHPVIESNLDNHQEQPIT